MQSAVNSYCTCNAVHCSFHLVLGKVIMQCASSYVCVLRSVLRDKAVVQGAIKMLQEEVGALKSTNMELQNQLCLVSASAVVH